MENEKEEGEKGKEEENNYYLLLVSKICFVILYQCILLPLLMAGPYLHENAPGAQHKICAPPTYPLEGNFLTPFCSMNANPSSPFKSLQVSG